MNLESKTVIKKLLKKYKVYPSKRLGQTFLIDKKVIEKVIETADLQPKDVVLEIGPGLGALTEEISKKVYPVKSAESGAAKPQFNGAGKTIAVVKDRKMCKILEETLKDFPGVEIINKDILKIPNSQLPISNYKIVANLPFYITAPTIMMFLKSARPPKEMVLIVQKEVAQRICAKPPKMNFLAVSVQFYVHPHSKNFGVGANPKIIEYISKKSSWPSPKVDSAIIKIVPQTNTDDKRIDTDKFFKIVEAGFSRPRKQIANNLSKMLKLDKQKLISLLAKTSIKPTQRAETLTVQDWINLSNNIHNSSGRLRADSP